MRQGVALWWGCWWQPVAAESRAAGPRAQAVMASMRPLNMLRRCPRPPARRWLLGGGWLAVAGTACLLTYVVAAILEDEGVGPPALRAALRLVPWAAPGAIGGRCARWCHWRWRAIGRWLRGGPCTVLLHAAACPCASSCTPRTLLATSRGTRLRFATSLLPGPLLRLPSQAGLVLLPVAVGCDPPGHHLFGLGSGVAGRDGRQQRWRQRRRYEVQLLLWQYTPAAQEEHRCARWGVGWALLSGVSAQWHGLRTARSQRFHDAPSALALRQPAVLLLPSRHLFSAALLSRHCRRHPGAPGERGPPGRARGRGARAAIRKLLRGACRGPGRRRCGH